jgi:site-specific DNA recombinase
VDGHDRLDSLEVALRSATEPIDTSTPSGRLIFQMLASFAEYERETIRERTRAGLYRAFRGGKHMGRIPYGYRATEDAQLEVEPDEAEIVRDVITNIADGSTLYREARRLNDIGISSPGWRYGTGERKPGKSWSATTISNLVHQPAYSGTHRVRINGGKDSIEREVPVIVTPNLQERAKVALSQNKRYRNRKYLLAGLVKCTVCGFACVGHPSASGGKKYHFYACTERSTERVRKDASPHRRPYVNARWLEETVWADVRGFLENPGEVLERVREQLRDADDTKELMQRREDLAKRLAGKQAEKDRYVRLYAQNHISESELELYLADLKNQINNLRLLIESVEADLSQKHQHKELAETTHAWLVTLRERIAEVEEDTEEAFRVRRQLVKLLVAGITLGPRREDRSTEIRITYRFDPPEDAGGEDVFVGTVPNNGAFVMPSGVSSAGGGDVFQFASGPVESELTGPYFTPDGKTLFLCVQHPGEESESKDNPTSTWPDGDIPRPAVVAITGFA